MNNNRRVYSTDTGRICPTCDNAMANCVCKKKNQRPPNNIKIDGIIRIKRETKGRKGKTVTTIQGFDPGITDMKTIAACLKACCGAGGSVKSGTIIIQGDHRKTVQAELAKQGFTVKLAGG